MANFENDLGNVENPMEFKPAGVPEKISMWTKVRNFLLQDITVTLTPKQEQVFKEVHDFWHQEITARRGGDFLFQEIKIVDNITL